MERKESINEENIEIIQNEYEALVEKSLMYRLKRWEKNLMKKLRMLYNSYIFIKEYKEKIKKQNEELNKEIKKEMANLENEKKEIIKQKDESIKNIEIRKQNLIKENDQKYNKIFSDLESIKNDKNKLIEYLKNNKDLF